MTYSRIKSIAFLAALTAAGCDRSPSGKGTSDAGGKIIVCTTTMIADLARQIGGERVRVVGIMKPGTDPHIYDPTPDDSIWFRKADLVLVNGLHLEGKMIDMIEAAGAKAVHLGEHPSIRVRQSASAAAPDPHVWWNAGYYVHFAEQARDALKRVDPDHAAEFEQRATLYIAQLKDADARVRRSVQTIPAAARYMITSHDAFYYYGEAYGLEVDAVLGISTDAQAGADEPNRLARLTKERGVPALFHETSVSAAQNELVDTIQRLAKDKYQHTLKVAGPLFSDSLGDDPATDTYLEAFLANTRMIVEALGGSAAALDERSIASAPAGTQP